MKKLAQWTRSSEGYCQSKDGRFTISPLYEGTTRAQSYQAIDTKTGRIWTADAQKHLKFDVENLLAKERAVTA